MLTVVLETVNVTMRINDKILNICYSIIIFYYIVRVSYMYYNI